MPKTNTKGNGIKNNKGSTDTKKNTVISASSSRAPKFDWRWCVLVLALVITLPLTFFFNQDVEDLTANRILGSIDLDNGDQKINWDRYQTVDIELTETITISESGTYHLTGTLEDGQVVIDAGIAEVRLLLDNVTIKNSNGPAIVCYNAEDLVIETIGQSFLEDGESYATNYDEDISGVIYSKSDLSFNGDGMLNIAANHQDGIIGKDAVKFNRGDYVIVAADDAIRGKDSVRIVGGNFNINSVNDAIKTTNETDRGRGFVLVEGGTLTIDTKAKGINATNSVLIYGGEQNIKSYDDAIHSNNYVGVVDGLINIESSDDGIHADNELIIDGGKINIIKSYEGLEAQKVTINNGDTNIISSDDGINAGGGSDNASTAPQNVNDRNADANCIIRIFGGMVYVNSTGDGLDSNGRLYFGGGRTIIDGPTDNGNGALDSGLGIEMQGGTVIAIGAAGMAESLGANSGIPNLSLYFQSVQPADTKIEIKDSNKNLIMEHTSTKVFNHLSAGSESFILGETYTVYLNGDEYTTFTISEVTTTIGNPNANRQQPPSNRR